MSDKANFPSWSDVHSKRRGRIDCSQHTRVFDKRGCMGNWKRAAMVHLSATLIETSLDPLPFPARIVGLSKSWQSDSAGRNDGPWRP